jgi:large exoprotein involved in heme utilization and adhesion
MSNFGDAAAGDVIFNATELLEIRGLGNNGFAHSLVTSENFGRGSGSNVIVSAQRLRLQDGAQIITRTFGLGSSGSIKVDVADAIDINGFSRVDPSLLSGILTTTYTSGQSGDVTVSTGQIKITDGGLISSVTTGSGAGGDTTVYARRSIEVIGESPLVFSASGITATSFNRGRSGNLRVTTSRLLVQDGASVSASIFGSGNSGEAYVTGLDRIEVRGTGSASGVPSRIAARGPLLPPAFQRAFNLPPQPTGNSGNLVINSPSLQISDGAVVGVNHQGVGNAGNLTINAETIALDRGGSLSASTLSGQGGNMSLQTNYLVLRRGSSITATAGGVGNGGNITLNAPVIVGFENSDIIANAFQGNGGNIRITTEGIFGLKFRPQLTLENDITASSQLGINGSVQINVLSVDPTSGLGQLAIDLADANQQMAQGCAANPGSSFVVTGRGGMQSNPTNQAGSVRPWADARNLTAFHRPSVAAAAPPPPAALVQATGWRRNADGKVELYADTPTTAPSGPLGVTCAAASAQPH